jgi:hypothetical protein
MSSTPDRTYRDRSNTRTDPNTTAVDTSTFVDHDHHTDDSLPTHRTITSRQRDRFGGIKWGSAFFGLLTAIGTAVLLTALVAAAGTALGLAWADGLDQAANRVTQNSDTAETLGIAGAIVVAVVLLIAYYCGGYVAGRMARFSGMKQGIAVWVWTIVVTIVTAIVIAATDVQLTMPNGLPRLPTDDGSLTTGGIIAALIALAVSLIGAVLGGLAGMRFHRTVDRAALDTDA